MKKLMMVLALMPLLAMAYYTEDVDGITWDYIVIGGTVQIGKGTGYYTAAIPTATTGAITIPSIINGMPVTSIGERAFYGCKALTGVTIPDGVTDVGYEAFRDCSGLTYVSIPESVTRIGAFAFEQTQLRRDYYVMHTGWVIVDNWLIRCDSSSYITISGSVKIPDGAKKIADSAFNGCGGLTSVTIPESVKIIGQNAFMGCKGLKSVTIPSGVISIGQHAFSGCSGLAEVSIVEGVKAIGGCAFYGCSGLTSVTIPSSVTSIEGSAFSGTKFLNDHPDGLVTIDDCLIKYKGSCSGAVEIPDGVRMIADSAFSGCSGLTSVTIPSSVMSIGDSAFSHCSGLMSVDIPQNVTSVEPYTFYGCSGLTSVKIPANVMSIGEFAFYDCSGLRSVTIPISVKSIGGSVFSGTRLLSDRADGLVVIDDCLVGYKGICSGSVEIPNGVRLIADRSFYYCSKMTSVTIPSSVTSIGENAFRGCGGLTSVAIPAFVTSLFKTFPDAYAGINDVVVDDGVTSIGSSLFSRCRELSSVTIPLSVTTIERDAFSKTKLLNNHPNGFVIIDDCLVGYKGACTETIEIPNGTRLIADYALCDCNGLIEVTIPPSLVGVGESAFAGCKKLSRIDILDLKHGAESVLHLLTRIRFTTRKSCI